MELSVRQYTVERPMPETKPRLKRKGEERRFNDHNAIPYNGFEHIHLREVKVWSHQSVLQRNAFKLSAVRATMTSGGETRVRMSRATLTKPHNKPNFFISEASVILTAFAERTRNITEILKGRIWKCYVSSSYLSDLRKQRRAYDKLSSLSSLFGKFSTKLKLHHEQ